MKKLILILTLAITLSLPLLSIELPADPSTLPAITWEEITTGYEIIYVDNAGGYTIININGKLMVVYN